MGSWCPLKNPDVYGLELGAALSAVLMLLSHCGTIMVGRASRTCWNP